MKQTRSLLALCALLKLDVSIAFSVAPSLHIAGTQSSFVNPRTSTCLFSSEGNEEQTPAPEEPANDAANNILNSPAFLKRKVEVLQSDIAKVEQNIEEAKQRLEAGKAEWGGQLDELQKEVSQ